ncbi:MAG: M48 family metallopeptidase [Candidatus Omnitrophica bacterium]|nr:M48 family metallopeptidase [Candidatus Omnitrophota bacterium]
MSKEISRLIVIILLAGITGCVTLYNPVSQRKEYYVTNEKGEIEWGISMANQFIQGKPLLRNSLLLAYVEKIGGRLGSVSHRNYLKYRFYIIDEPIVNAFAVPGGFIFIYRGLLDKLDENELAFVLAHEIGHICARHGLKRLGASVGTVVLGEALLRKPNQKDAKELVYKLFNLVSLGYSRSDELQADALAFEYTHKAGYDPTAGIRVFELFKRIEKSQAQVPIYLRTHPYPDARIGQIQRKLKEDNKSE